MSSEAAQLDRQTERRAKLFRGLGDGSRLAILQTLRAGPRTVSEIVDATSLSQSNVSNHLRCLTDCGLVRGNQQGRFVHYALADKRIEDLLVLADRLLSISARGVDNCTNYTVR